MFSLLLLSIAAFVGGPADTPPTPYAAQRAVRTASAPRIGDTDADLVGGRLNLETETAITASKVTFTYRGRSISARRTETDTEDRTRDWGRTVNARGARAGDRITLRVKACTGGKCTTKTVTERLEREND